MSNTKREPLLSDKDITTAAAIQGDASMAINDNDFAAGERARGYTSGAVDAKDIYEADRAKDAELIQQLVDALDAIEAINRTQEDQQQFALACASHAGFKPTEG